MYVRAVRLSVPSDQARTRAFSAPSTTVPTPHSARLRWVKRLPSSASGRPTESGSFFDAFAFALALGFFGLGDSASAGCVLATAFFSTFASKSLALASLPVVLPVNEVESG